MTTAKGVVGHHLCCPPCATSMAREGGKTQETPQMHHANRVQQRKRAEGSDVTATIATKG